MTSEESNKEAVMVIGDGIGYCQAAIDLAESGFKVYIVEKSPSVAGIMVKLDKNVPSGACAKCILAPKLVGEKKHPNIELITNAEILKLEGKPGNFSALINKKTDDKATAKLEQIQQCPVQIISGANEGSTIQDVPYFQLPESVSLKILVEKGRIAPCQNACPAHVRSQEYVDLISKGKFQESLDLIRERCPLPSAIGRICPHPCEVDCNRNHVEEPINICGLKRFVANHVYNNIEEKIEFLEEKKDKKVAIIGSGPSGLTVAYHLAKRGYPVTIFERESVAGGMLRLGVPNYRLPPKALEVDIEHIKKLGVEIKTNTPIGPPGPTIKELRKDFDAVYIGVGLPVSRRLNIEGEDLENIIYGIDFLKACSLGEEISVGKNVLVVGGGDVAVDVARSALRKGAERVEMLMLESEDIIPANTWEVEEAKEEGIIFNVSRGPNKFVGAKGKVIGLETLHCSSVFDKDGRFNPVLEECTEDVTDGDMVIVTIGQAADLAFLDKDIKVGRGIEIDRNNFQTSVSGVFAGGEVANGPGSAIKSIASGNKAAIAMEKYLKSEDISKLTETIPDYDKEEVVSKEDLQDLESILKEPRKNNTHISPEIRKKNFEEFTKGMDEKSAMEEANRCLSCGVCEECFECVKSCVADIIDHEKIDETISLNIGSVILSPGDAWLSCYDIRKGTQYRWKIVSPIAEVNEEKCIGCGECRDICPFEAIEKNETTAEFKGLRDSFNPSVKITRNKSKVNPDTCKGCGACVAICPVGALSLKYFTNKELEVTIKSHLE